jgi:YHS domain-containing protein
VVPNVIFGKSASNVIYVHFVNKANLSFTYALLIQIYFQRYCYSAEAKENIKAVRISTIMVFIPQNILIKMERDVVCGMEVSESSKYKSMARGKTYYFCSTDCKAKCDANPINYTR